MLKMLQTSVNFTRHYCSWFYAMDTSYLPDIPGWHRLSSNLSHYPHPAFSDKLLIPVQISPSYTPAVYQDGHRCHLADSQLHILPQKRTNYKFTTH